MHRGTLSRWVAGLFLASLSACAVGSPALGSPAFASPAIDSSSIAAGASPTATATHYLTELRASFGPEDRTYAGLKLALRVVWPVSVALINLLLLFSGASAKLGEIAHAMGPKRWVRTLVFATLYGLVLWTLTLPLAWYAGFSLEQQFSLSRQTAAGWLENHFKSLLVVLVAFAFVPVLSLGYRVIEKSPRRWWLWLGLAMLPVAAVGTLLQPVLVDPLFNRVKPVQDSALRTEVLRLAERARVPEIGVFQVAKSGETGKLNAYVTGFGASQRIVLWDTALRDLPRDELLFVVAHEMGHYRLGHLWLGIAVTAVLSLAFFFMASVLARAALSRWGDSWGIASLHDVASLPLLVVSLGAVVFLAQPLLNGYSRHVESRADAFGVELTGDSDAAARALLKLAEQNRSDPDPPAWVEAVFYTHPPAAKRMRTVLGIRPRRSGASSGNVGR